MKKQTLTLEHNYRPAKFENGSLSHPPAIIMLHGFGSDENDLFSFAQELPEKYAVISLKAPIALQPYGNAWYQIYFDNAKGKFSDEEQAVRSRDLVSDTIDEIIEKYKIDADNITLLGFSQGTILSFSIALSYPEKVKNVIGLSGYIHKSLIKDGLESRDFSRLNVYSSHGTVDQVLPVEWARETKPFLEKLGIKCDYSEFPVGHGVAPENFHEFKMWLEKTN